MPITIKITAFALVSIAGLIDVKTRRIPNWISVTGLCIGIAINSFLFRWAGFRLSLLGAVVGFAIYLVLYLLRAMGAGDVKLMAALGALVGPRIWVAIFFFTAITGGLIALILLLTKGRLKRTVHNVSIMLHQLSRFQAPYHATAELDVRSGKGLTLPHGAMIALGAITYLVVEYYR
jgi:prepilin peptidase CpaA